ncbi:hypothetical protein LTR84_013149 [Exophiala bonariae]|uniref:Major facilitator superfamily (MFS) profile domain-containing protein n=1 Tax=Exophiala bonariae TaxID=1690606 RepID=A0AAV9NE73_9EURO|nr:hypothetical protein LTR84_013149 [Exophiala bonariae]
MASTENAPLNPGISNSEKDPLLYDLVVDSDGFVDFTEHSNVKPRNWLARRKAYNLGFLLDFITTAISAAGTPAAEFAKEELHISHTQSLFGFTSIYLIGQGLGGLVFSPFSEAFGRRWLYIISSFAYSGSCVLVGVAPNATAAIVGRFLSGVLSSIPKVIVSGSIEDLYDSEARIWIFFIWNVTVNCSLIFGPIYAAYVAMVLGWRWIFHIAAIILAIVSVMLFSIRESRQGLLLSKQVAQLQKLNPHQHYQVSKAARQPSFQEFVQVALVRPWILLFTEPIVSLTATLKAIPIVYDDFGLSMRQSMLILLFIALGLISSVLTRFYDRLVARRRRRASLPLKPEDKLIGFIIAAPLLAISLWWFAWSIPPKMKSVPWIVSAISLVPLGYATNEFDTVLGGYLADSYPNYAASAFTSLSLLRAFLSAAFPLFTDQLFVGLGNNLAGSVLASVATLFFVVPIIFVKYGERLRMKSQFNMPDSTRTMPRNAGTH